MARTCDLCGAGSLKGNRVSHSNRKTIHRQEINLQSKKVDGVKVKVCTKCMRTMKKMGM
jgi:large subunit ribosomal protein L28